MAASSVLPWHILVAVVAVAVFIAGVLVARAWNRALKAEVEIQTRERRAAREFSDNLFRSMIDGAVVVNEDGVHVEVNDAFCDMVGFPREEIVGKGTPKPYWPPEELDRINALFNRALAGELRSVEVTFMRRNGERFPVLINPLRIRDHRGKMVMFGMIKDMTDLKRAEAELRENKTFLATAQQVARIGSWQWAFDSDRVRWSEEMCWIHGVAPEDFDGKMLAVLDNIHPGDREAVMKKIDTTIRERRCVPLEYRIVRPDGSVRTVSCEGEAYYDEEGTVVGLIGTVQDITERKRVEGALRQSEEKFRTIFENAPVMIDSFDRHGNCLLWNRECEKTLGWTKQEIMAEEDPLALAFPDPDVRRYVMETLRKADGKFREYEVRTKDGERRTLMRADFRLPNGTAISVGYDNTEHRRTEEDLRRSQEQLRAFTTRLEAVREEEGASIAREIHDELGQKLTGLKMDTYLLQRRLSEIENPCGNQAFLLEKLKAMSREVDDTIRAVRRISTRLRPVVLDDLGLTGALEWQARRFAARTGIVCDLRMADSVDLDPDRSTAVFRIFQEILTNAARHSGATRVNADLHRENSTLVMNVHDDGRGIRNGDIENSNTLGIQGMKERAQACGGDVRIESEPGKGTRIVARIPLDLSKRASGM